MHPYILLIFAMLFFSGNFIVGKLFAGTIPPFTLAFLRSTMALLVLMPLCYKQVFINKPLWIKEWKPLVAIATSGLVLFNVCLYLSINYTTTVNAAIVDALTPAVAALLGFIILKERLSKVQWFGILLSFISIVFIITQGSLSVLLTFSINSGDLIMLLGIVFWAFYSIFIKVHGGKFPVLSGLVVTMIISALILLPFAGYEFVQSGNFFADLQWQGYLGLLYIGIFPSALALLFWYRAVDEVGPSKASVFFNLVPVFTTTLAVVFLDEPFTFVHLFGATFVLVGVYLSTKTPKSKLQVNTTRNENVV